MLVIAIDGPSGSGKSSTSRGVAKKLGLRYLDTGAMYRAITWWMLQNDITEPEKIAERSTEPVLEVGVDPDHPTIAVDGQDVSDPIRTREVTNFVSTVSAVPVVRRRMVALQREVIGAGGIVVEGRDIGTTVAPDAAVKVFLTADPDERTRRRQAEGLKTSKEEIARRDQRDSSRTASPTAKADDAVELDTTTRTLDEVIDAIVALVPGRA